jgi:hypothetical protein
MFHTNGRIIDHCEIHIDVERPEIHIYLWLHKTEAKGEYPHSYQRKNK